MMPSRWRSGIPVIRSTYWHSVCGSLGMRQSLLAYFTNHRSCLNWAIFVLAISAVALIKILFLLGGNLKHFDVVYEYKNRTFKTNTSERLPIWPSGGWPYNTYGFHPVNNRGVYSFWNVCIEEQPNIVQRETDYLGKKLYFHETKRIIVYNSFFRNGMQQLYVSGSHNTPWNRWDVHFSRDPIPATHVLLNTTAFFLTQTCPANFHHFWIDEFVPLFCVVKQANRLHPGAENQIIYRLPTNLTEASTRGCYNKTTFEDVLRSLFTAAYHDVFYNMETNTCFSSAVFGVSADIVNPRLVVDHVLQHLNINVSRRSATRVTIIQRQHRRIINVDELVKAAGLLGFTDTRIVYLEQLGVKEQASVIANSRVMIGVQGAGLQWAAFMPPGSNLIEIAWPYKFWGFYFGSYVTQYQIKYHKLFAQHVLVNWSSYEQMVRGGNPVSVEERLQLLQSRPKTSSLDNIWKWADIIVNKDELIEILSMMDFDSPVAAEATFNSPSGGKSEENLDQYHHPNSSYT